MKKILFTIMLLCISVAALARITYNIPYASVVPDFDGQISAGEWDDALAVSVSYEDFVLNGNGVLVHGDAPVPPEDISATYYFKWDESFLYMAFEVTDDVLLFRRDSPGPYNGQDAVQIAFNPYDDPEAVYQQDAWIFDIVAETGDNFGPDVYRHTGAIDVDPNMISSEIHSDGYVIELALEWNNIRRGLNGRTGDIHGLGLMILDFDSSEVENLIRDFPTNTPTQWNKMVLVDADGCGSWGILPGDINADCYIDLKDFAILASQWLQCTDPENPDCNI